MIQTLYLFENQNNYFNRRIITQGVDTLENILGNPKLIKSVSSQNIAMNDKVEISFTLNCFGNEELFNRTPDYMVMKSENDSHVVKLTRWFIMRMEEGRNGQFEVQARRDLLADFKTNILNADSYIERGFVYQSDPLIYNEEGYSLNQIKVAEIKMKDKSRCGWIVGYIARQDGNNQSYSATVNFSSVGSASSNYTDLPTNVKSAISSNGAVYDSVAEEYKISFNVINYRGANYYTFYQIFYVECTFINNNWDIRISMATKGFATETEEAHDDYSFALFKRKTYRLQDNLAEVRALASAFLSNVDLTLPRNQFIDTVEASNSYVSNPMQYNEKTYLYSTNTYATIKTRTVGFVYFQTDVSNNNNVYTNMLAAANTAVVSNTNYEVINTIVYGMSAVGTNQYQFEVNYVNAGSYTLDIPTTRNSLNDAPYDMFCMPYSEFEDAIDMYPNSIRTKAKSQVALDAAQKITEVLGARIYDIQLLPYCPIQDFVAVDGLYGPFVRANLVEHVDFEYIYKVNEGGNTIASIILFPYHSKEDFKLYWNDWNHDLIRFGTFVFEPSEWCPRYEYAVKLYNEGEVLRLNSPNYAATFEFNRAKNGMTIEYWNVSLHYKPYQPFVRIAPDFKGIYGREYSDNRGLILAGDFSLPMVSDAWTNYQIQNKNYQLMFDRDIKQMTYKNWINAATTMADVSAYGLMGAAAGTISGFKSGGTAGAIVGGVGAGVSAMYSPFKNYLNNSANTIADMLYKKDMFKYQLGNIKALPDTITKVGCLNNIFKIYPLLEQYQCTDSEAELVVKNVKFNGMIINKEGKIINYVDSQEESYVKAKIIRFNEENFDTTIARAIAQEVSQGFYIDINGVSKYE